MKAFQNLTKKQKTLGLVALGVLLIFAFIYNSDFLRPDNRTADAEKVSQLKEQENKDLHALTGKGKIKNLTILVDKEEVEIGSQAQFTAQIEGEGDYDPSIFWKITSPHKEDTVISEAGLLQVGASENAQSLTICGTAKEDQTRAYKEIKLLPKKDQANPKPGQESPQASQPIATPKNKEELKQKAIQEQAKVSPEERAKKDQEDKRLKQEAIAQSSKGKKDKYLTDPTPAGRPKPVEPGSVEKEDRLETCTLSIRCDTILQNMDRFDMDKIDVLPVDGLILPPTQVNFHPGESVFDVLGRETKARKIHMEANFTPAYNSAYVMGIHNLYEFDCGELSGWMYKVNGWFPNYGCSRYQVKAGDQIEWVYTCDLGRDVGDNSMVK